MSRRRKAIRLDGSRPVGQIVRELREAAGLSRPELSRRVGARMNIDPRAVSARLSKWEAGLVRTPEAYLFDSVAQECGYGLALVELPPAPAELEGQHA